MKIFIIGGHGILGKHLCKVFPESLSPTHDELDIDFPLYQQKWVLYNEEILKNIDTVLLCASLKTKECEKNKLAAFRTNILGTSHVVEYCHSENKKLIFISTDWVFRGNRGNYKPDDEYGPTCYYGETKLAGEFITKSLNNYLIIRLSFSDVPFPYSKAYTNQFSTKLPVNEAAKQIHYAVSNNEKGIKHIYGKKQSIYEYAKSINGNKKITPEILDDDFSPLDTSLSD